jgi:hypothetical protein
MRLRRIALVLHGTNIRSCVDPSFRRATTNVRTMIGNRWRWNSMALVSSRRTSVRSTKDLNSRWSDRTLSESNGHPLETKLVTTDPRNLVPFTGAFFPP